MPALRRKLELARLVAGLAAAEPHLAAGTAAFDLADSLADLLDEMEGEGLAPAAFARVDAGEHAAHWQRSLRFLDAHRRLPRRRRPADGQGRLRAAAEALAAAWAADRPPHPVHRRRLDRLARRDPRLHGRRRPAAAGRRSCCPASTATCRPRSGTASAPTTPAPPTTPSTASARLADALGFDPAAVSPPGIPPPPPAPERNALVSLALRPAPVTDQWRTEGAALAGRLAPACATLDWVEAPDARAEALAIALAPARGRRDRRPRRPRHPRPHPRPPRHRRARPLGASSPTTAPAARWRSPRPASSSAASPPSPARRLTPEDLLVLLKHPLVNSAPGARRAHLRLTARLERARLRGGAPWIDWPDLAAWAADARRRGPRLDRLAPRRPRAPRPPGATAPLAEHVARHRAAAEALAAGPDGAPAHALWEEEAGPQALRPPRRPRRRGRGRRARSTPPSTARSSSRWWPPATCPSPPSSPTPASPSGAPSRPASRPPTSSSSAASTRASGRGSPAPTPGSAAASAAPRPAEPRPPDRPLGPRLPAGDGRAARHPHPRPPRRRGADRASRWLLRLENLLAGLGPEGQAALAAAKARGEPPRRRRRPPRPARRAHAPPPGAPPRARRPRPARAELSVTQVEQLVRDPYGVYARSVLRLRRLDPPGRKPDALARGRRSTTRSTPSSPPPRPACRPTPPASSATPSPPRSTGAAPWPAVNAIWTARLDRSARWFLDSEADRRARGAPAAREVEGRRDVDGLARPFAVTARADRIDRRARRLRASTTTSRAQPHRPPRRGPSTSSSPSKRRSPRPAASKACRPAQRVHLELLKFGKTGEDPRPRRRRRRDRRLLGALHRAHRPLPGPGERLPRPPPARRSSPGQRLRPPLPLGRMGRRRRPGGETGERAAVAAQIRAAEPTASSWVSANAGSGKTRVLTDRVARLLLAGTEPQSILCLTYTKAAAAEMQNRLFETLGGWAMLDDAALRAALARARRARRGDRRPSGSPAPAPSSPARSRPRAA